MDEMGVGPAVPEGLGLAGVGEGVGEGQALHDGDADPEAVGRRQHDQKLVEVPAGQRSINFPTSRQGSAKVLSHGCVNLPSRTCAS